jgi:hypothetical protein
MVTCDHLAEQPQPNGLHALGVGNDRSYVNNAFSSSA